MALCGRFCAIQNVVVTTVLLAGGIVVDYVVTFVFEEASLKTGMDHVPETWCVKFYCIRWKSL